MMKKYIKRSFKWLLRLTESIISILRILLFSSFNPNCNSVPKETGEECYILGNGPSLKEIIADKGSSLNNQNLFVVNDFVLSELFERVRPKYYVLVDPGYWVNNTFEDMIELRNEVFKLLNQKTCWKLVLFISKQAYDTGFFQKTITNENIDIRFFNTTEVKGFSGFMNFAYYHNFGMPVLQNVLVASIFLALNLKFSTINILGAEHSWLKSLAVSEENEVCQVNNHFYDHEEMSSNVWLKFTGEPYKLHELLIDLSKMFYAYHLLNDYANYMKSKITNLTKESYIDAFGRKKMRK